MPAADSIKGTPPAKKPMMGSKTILAGGSPLRDAPRRPRRNLVRDFYNGTSGSSGPASLKAASHEKAPPAAAVTHETPTRSGTTRAMSPKRYYYVKSSSARKAWQNLKAYGGPGWKCKLHYKFDAALWGYATMRGGYGIPNMIAVYDRAKIVIIISQCRGISIAEAEIIFESDYKHNFTQVKAGSPVLADPTQITKV